MRKVYLLKKLPSNLLKKCQYEEVTEFFNFLGDMKQKGILTKARTIT